MEDLNIKKTSIDNQTETNLGTTGDIASVENELNLSFEDQLKSVEDQLAMAWEREDGADKDMMIQTLEARKAELEQKIESGAESEIAA